MARILYGIHGTGHGHAMRGLTIARALPDHEFLFVASDDAPSVLEPEFPTKRLPNLGTVFKNYKVDLPATIKRAFPLLANRKKYIREALKIIEDFRPDVCMTDLEYFVPRAAEVAGIPCLTLDHQHTITSCRHEAPLSLRRDAFIQGLTPRYLFRPTDWNIIISFYAPPLLPRHIRDTRVLPPILRDGVIRSQPRDDRHILVYQSNSTDKRLIDFLLSSTDRTAYVFGYGDMTGRTGNVVFRSKSESEFIDLLASCAYVIQGGSHTLMSEALYLGKPILSIPLEAMVEQRFNAFYLEKLGYGRVASMDTLNKDFLERFERDLPNFQSAIRENIFLGNDLVFDLVDRFAKTGSLR
ncbi:MAG: teichoic acid biosynthesis protein [Desulfovibrio sp.]|nr:teichoic acid biosynthesis protein [Desulfovibrio sp.]